MKDELRKVFEPQELQGKVHDDRLGKVHESFKIPSTMKVSGGVLYEPHNDIMNPVQIPELPCKVIVMVGVGTY